MSQHEIDTFADEMNDILPYIAREFGRRQAKQLFKGKFTFPQFSLLDYLSREGGATMTGLARFMSVTTPAMTGTINRLVKAGYCQRVYDAEDRRLIRVNLTRRGHEVVRKVNSERHGMIIEVFGSLSARERREYLRILKRIRQILISRNKA